MTSTYAGWKVEVYMIVSPTMPDGFVDYEFKTWRPRRFWCWC